jgi:SAM-dependent methyltransferase
VRSETFSLGGLRGRERSERNANWREQRAIARRTSRSASAPQTCLASDPVSKLTGERPMEGATPDALLALHDAGYREVIARLGNGTVLDVGCGVGDETVRLTAAGRFVVGVDYSAQTVVDAARRHSPPALRFVGSDGARLGIRGTGVDYAISSHVIEHFENPIVHVAELARVLADGGTAFVITPNAPADFENPFHVYLFEAAHLVSMLSLFFHQVECVGLEGDEALHADFAARRASGERILKLDVFGLRHRIPRRAYVWTYERALPVAYRILGSERSGVGSGLDASHFFVTDTIMPTTPVLFATARRPRRRVSSTA